MLCTGDIFSWRYNFQIYFYLYAIAKLKYVLKQNFKNNEWY